MTKEEARLLALCLDTARVRATTRPSAPTTLPAGACDTAPLRPRHDHALALGHACVCWLGQVGCFVHLTQF